MIYAINRMEKLSKESKSKHTKEKIFLLCLIVVPSITLVLTYHERNSLRPEPTKFVLNEVKNPVIQKGTISSNKDYVIYREDETNIEKIVYIYHFKMGETEYDLWETYDKSYVEGLIDEFETQYEKDNNKNYASSSTSEQIDAVLDSILGF